MFRITFTSRGSTLETLMTADRLFCLPLFFTSIQVFYLTVTKNTSGFFSGKFKDCETAQKLNLTLSFETQSYVDF